MKRVKDRNRSSFIEIGYEVHVCRHEWPMTAKPMTLRDDISDDDREADDTTRCDDLLRRMTLRDDAPRSGHRTCSSSIESRHQS